MLNRTGNFQFMAVIRCCAILLFVLFTTISPPTRAAAVHAPDFSIVNRAGNSISLAELRGKIVYLDFWASWCKPCRQSFPWMNKMQQRYRDRGVVFLAINLDAERSLADRFLGQEQPNFMVGFDSEGLIAEKYQLNGMPTAYLIDQNGLIRFTHAGFLAKNKYHYERDIEQLIALSTVN